MKRILSQSLLNEKTYFAGKNVSLPTYDREQTPVTGICFSPGRMGFGHLGDIVQDVLNTGGNAGLVVGVETFSQAYYDRLVANDFLVTQIIYENEKGAVSPKIQGAFKSAVFLTADEKSQGWQNLLKLARDEKVQYATINAPEGAYGMVYSGGDFATPISDVVKQDMANGTVKSDPAKWTRFALERYKVNLPFAFVSCTNFSKNGFFTGATLRTIARAWVENGFVPEGFLAYLLNPQRMAFPNTMVDRIAVAPDEKTEKVMEELQIDSNVVVTERTRYWVIEDKFPAGRPQFEKADGVFMCADFEEVKLYEDMKLRILNMSHTVLATLGVLLGYRGNYQVYAGFKNEILHKIITDIMGIVKEIIDSPKSLNPSDFAQNALARLNNANIPDDPMRIALNGSTKILPRLMETYWEGKGKGISQERLNTILLPVAGFLRYTLGIDDAGNAYDLESDPNIDLLRDCAKKAKFGDANSASAFESLIRNENIMGAHILQDEETVQMIKKITAEMIAGKGAVENTLRSARG